MRASVRRRGKSSRSGAAEGRVSRDGGPPLEGRARERPRVRASREGDARSGGTADVCVRPEPGGLGRLSFWGGKMEFRFETRYDQRGLTAMARALRKTIRKKGSRRSHISGWCIVALAVVLVAAGRVTGGPWTLRDTLNCGVGVILTAILLTEDRAIPRRLRPRRPDFIMRRSSRYARRRTTSCSCSAGSMDRSMTKPR